jgi:multiple sugar transport system ATP-binding protein
MTRVSLDRVSKTFSGGSAAVRDLSLDVLDGEFLVLVGPSGCGKSTTLRMIAGLEDPTSGVIRIGDRIVNDLHPKDRDIAMVFQNYALYPHMTVRKNMSFALTLRKTPRAEIERRVAAAAEALGITPLLDRKPRALSGGERQRAAVGRAIVREPACFLFDEPLSNLDVKLRVQMRAELKALHLRTRTTTIYVTHDQEEAMTLGDRIAVMSGGVIQQVAPPLEVYRRPVNRFVAGFVGMPPMNLLDGIVRRRGDDSWAVEVAGVVFELPDTLAAAASPHVGRPVALGLRPEAFSIGSAGGSGAPIRGMVHIVEPLGDRQDVFFRAGDSTNLVARIDATTSLRPGEIVTFACRRDGMHLFEPGPFGRSLLPN